MTVAETPDLPVPRPWSCKLSEDGKWFIETVNGEERRFRIENIVFQGRTAFQDVMIVETEEFGRSLVIDGETQSAEDDEYIYHEALVQPAMLAHANPRRVLIIGGGEGATLREVLRHRCVERAVMVDIDGELVALARQYLDSLHQGAFYDRRSEVRICDGMAYVRQTVDRFDVVIVDVCDYVEDTAVAGLYSLAFFKAIADVVAPGGTVVVQSGELGRWTCSDHAGLARMLAASVGRAVPYSTFVESFWSEWSFLLAGALPQGYADLAPGIVDAAIERRRPFPALRFYDGTTHRRMFSLPKDIRHALAAVG